MGKESELRILRLLNPPPHLEGILLGSLGAASATAPHQSCILGSRLGYHVTCRSSSDTPQVTKVHRGTNDALATGRRQLHLNYLPLVRNPHWVVVVGVFRQEKGRLLGRES